MATKSKKTPVKAKKSPAKPAKKASSTKTSKAVVKTAAKKKAVKTAAKKPAPKKTAAVKAAVKKVKVAKKPAAKTVKSEKKKVTAVKSAAKKQPVVKKAIASKKSLTAVKKTAPAVKTAAKKTVAKKPNLKIVVSNKEKVQPITKATPKTAEKIKTTAAVGSIEKGVKKRIMESLEVKPIKLSTAGLFGVPPYEEKPGEVYMNEAQKEHFREILRRWKKELMEEVDRTKTHMQQDSATRHPDPSDNATQEEEFSLELRTRDRERKLIKKIDEALERIDQDDYGYCDACGIEIGIRRLEARPTAEMCIDCKTLDEIKEKQTRG